MSLYDGSQLLGFVMNSVAGIKPTYLPYADGLTVLYGLNGAGKTRTLEAIKDAYGGVRGGASLLVRVPDPIPKEEPEWDEEEWEPTELKWGSWDLPVGLCRAWSPEQVHWFEQSGQNEAELDSDLFEQVYREILVRTLTPPTPDTIDIFDGPIGAGRFDDIIEEALTQRHVLLLPVGSSRRPAWAPFPVITADPRYPHSAKELQGVKRELDYEAAGEEAWDELGEPPFESQDDIFSRTTLEIVSAPDLLLGIARGQWWTFQPSPMSQLPHVRPQLVDAFERAPEVATQDFFEIRRQAAGWLDLGAGRPTHVAPGSSDLAGWVQEAGRDLATTADRLCAEVLLDAPSLTLHVRAVEEWWSKDPFDWTFGPNSLPLDAMSTAQRRWATWAINIAAREVAPGAVPWLRHGSTLVVADEPEAALHRSAEAHMARSLGSWSQQPGRSMIVSTHSPELLNQQQARVFEVRRDLEGDSQLRALTFTDRTDLRDMGLLPSDLLRRTRGFLLVEGQHDEVLLQTWIGRELEELRVEVVPLRGAKQLPLTIESRVLFDFTDAQVFVVLDNTEGEATTEAWAEARRINKVEGSDKAGEYIRNALGRRQAEMKWLGQWLSRALETNRESRITPFGLQRLDIIEYLPVSLLVPNASGWIDLREEYENAHPERSSRPDFKTWLRNKKKARFDTEALAVAAAAGEVPREIDRLLGLIKQHLGLNDALP